MTSHRLTAEEGRVTPDGWVMLSRCPCDLLVLGRGRSVRRAKRRLVRRMRDHAEFQAAAGMEGAGW